MNLLNFKSYSFILFLAASLFCYYTVPKKAQKHILLATNAFFYFFSGPLNFIFIFLTAISTFVGAKKVFKLNSSVKEKKTGGMQKEELKDYKLLVQKKKRHVLVLMILINFGILFFLKYWNAIATFIDTCINADLSFLKFGTGKTLLLPLGISFYTFQTIAYFMDVYNSKYEAEHKFLQYVLFVSFFPQLIMGPINRYDVLGKQLKEEHRFSLENIKHGTLLVLFGAMKKYCVADLLAGRISSVLDHDYPNLPGLFIAIGILSYAIYQYADFSGGIDMVLGFSKMFGLEMSPNFRQPYFAVSLADFWRRWHITLGTWMRDYVFYPFVLTKKMQNISKNFMSKKTEWGKHLARTVPAGIANILVFLFVGVWHGPEFHFVLWGLYNGLVIAFGDFCKPALEHINQKLHIPVNSFGWKLFRIVRTFIIVNIGGYFDRIVDVPKSFLYLKRTITNFGSLKLLSDQDYMKSVFGSLRYVESELTLIFVSLIIVFVVSILKEHKINVYESIQKRNIVLRWSAYYVLMLLLLLSLSYAPGNPVFMYAQY